MRIEVPDGARYAVVSCVPNGREDAPVTADYPDGMDEDMAIVLLAAAQQDLALRATRRRQEEARRRLVAPLAAPEAAGAKATGRG